MTTPDAEPTTKESCGIAIAGVLENTLETYGLSMPMDDFNHLVAEFVEACDPLIAQVEALEEAARFMRDDYSPQGARGCSLCVYENGVFQRLCQLHQQIDALKAKNKRLRELVAGQAEDGGLWFEAITASEAYLQQELRRLHAAVEQSS